MTRCRHTESAGAWVLGALTDPEAEDYALHLETCEVCAHEVERLQGAVDLLPRAVEPVHPPVELRERVMAVVEHEAAVLRAAVDEPSAARAESRSRRRREWTFGMRPAFAAAAACAILLLGVAGGVLLSGDEDAARVVAASVDQAEAPGAEAALRVGDDRGESQLRVSGLPAPPEGRVYQVWIKRPGSAPDPTDALFLPDRGGAATVEVPGSLEGVESVLVTDEPLGGSRVPTKVPIIAAEPA